MKRNGVGGLILFLSAQVAANFAPEAAANQERVAPVQAPRVQTTRLVLADPSWDAFVFASTATAIALEVAAAPEQSPAQGDASWAFLAPEPQFDYLAALQDVGMARQFDEAQPLEPGWLS